MTLKSLVLIQMNQIYLIQMNKHLLMRIYWDLQTNNDEDDLEIPAFLRRQKN